MRTTRTLETLEQKAQKIKELFQKKSPNNWYFDEDILKWFNHEVVNNESSIDVTSSVETFKKVIITEPDEMLSYSQSMKLPLLQALEQFFEVVENKQFSVDRYAALIFLSTKMKSGSVCALTLWRDSTGEFELRVNQVFSGCQWDSLRSFLRKRTKLN